MGDCFNWICKPIVNCLSCLFCDCLCCECNCLIFPSPRASSLPEDTPIHEHLVSTSFHSFESVEHFLSRMAELSPLPRCRPARAGLLPSASSTSMETQKISVWLAIFSNPLSNSWESPSTPSSTPPTATMPAVQP